MHGDSGRLQDGRHWKCRRWTLVIEIQWLMRREGHYTKQNVMGVAGHHHMHTLNSKCGWERYRLSTIRLPLSLFERPASLLLPLPLLKQLLNHAPTNGMIELPLRLERPSRQPLITFHQPTIQRPHKLHPAHAPRQFRRGLVDILRAGFESNDEEARDELDVGAGGVAVGFAHESHEGGLEWGGGGLEGFEEDDGLVGGEVGYVFFGRLEGG